LFGQPVSKRDKGGNDGRSRPRGGNEKVNGERTAKTWGRAKKNWEGKKSPKKNKKKKRGPV